MASLVLIHGGSFDHRCWDLLLPHLDTPALAVDLPGRGAHPADPTSVTLAACAEAVVTDVDDAGFDDVVVVGHSLAGCSMPGVIGRLGGRVRHAVFVACTVPEDGSSCLDTLDPSIRAMAESAPPEPVPMGEAMARIVLGDDLDDEQFAWCVERMVPEAIGLTTQPVDLAPLRAAFPRTWIRTLADGILPADRQLQFAANVGDCPVVDLDAGHMCMVSHPEALARMLDDLADG
jgi:pimeloyl-ACP methyl ester carboxylesterase